MWIVLIILTVILVVVLANLGTKTETYIKVPGKGYVKVPSRKPILPAGALPYTKRAFKNPDSWDMYKSIASSAHESCANIHVAVDAEKCRKAFPVPN